MAKNASLIFPLIFLTRQTSEKRVVKMFRLSNKAVKID